MPVDAATIAAVSTPPGQGAIGVVRMSGTEATEIGERVFRRLPARKPVDFSTTPSHRVLFGEILDPESGTVIDEVLLTWMASPSSFTTEDTIEISCHGGSVPLQETLRVLLAQGARPAEPGEFTLRAFLNGRIDLSQAEAVNEIVNARTAEGLRLAVEDLQGDLQRRVALARDSVVSLLAYLDAAADFPDDEIPAANIDGDLRLAISTLDQVVKRGRAGRVYRDGAHVALVGRPNVGKSSLMNALLQSDRAIVTPIAGTTRDVIAETLNIRGIPVTLLDTAGISETVDVVEQLGVARSRKALESSAAAVFVLDGSTCPTVDDLEIAGTFLSRAAQFDSLEMPLVIAINKHDLPDREDQSHVTEKLSPVPVVSISTQTGFGLDELESVLFHLLGQNERSDIQPSLINARQQAALEQALAHLDAASQTRAGGYPIDLMATDVRAALHAIGDVTGENIDEAVLTEIFSRFCIGK
jgi:tRNA modification GTPase